MAHERNGGRVAEEVHAALVIQGCWRAYKNHHRPRMQTGIQQAGLKVADQERAQLSPADAFEAALTVALARQSLPESGRAEDSKGTGQGNFTLTPPNTPALGTSPPTGEPGVMMHARARGSPPQMAMHAIPEEAEGTVVQDRAALPAPTVQPNAAENAVAAAAAAASSQAACNDQVTDLASVVMPEQYGKLFKEPPSPTTAMATQVPEAVQLGGEWSVPVAGTLHVAKALESLDTEGEQATPQANAAHKNSEPGAAQLASTPTPDPKSNGYTTDVEDEAAGGPKGDLQDHISRVIIRPATGGTGGTSEAQVLVFYERFPPPQGPVQEPGPEAEQRQETEELQPGGQSPRQQEQTSVRVNSAPEEQNLQPPTGRRIVLQGQAGPEAQAPTPRPAPRRQQVQEPVVLGGPAAVGDGDWGDDTVLVGGSAAVPTRSATRSIPVGGPTTPEIGPESRGAPPMASTPLGQGRDNISGGFGAGGGMQASAGQTGGIVGSTAWGAPEQATSASWASTIRAGAGARAGKLKDAAYAVLYALDDVAHAAANARGNLGVIIAEADKIGDAPASKAPQHAEAQRMEQDGASGLPGRVDMLGAMQRLSNALQEAYSQEDNTAGQEPDDDARELQHAGSSDVGWESVDTPRMPKRGLGIRAQEILTVEQEEVWAAAAVGLAPKEAPEASPCADNPIAFAAAIIAGGLVKLLIFAGLALSMWTCLAFIWDYDQHVERVLPPA